MRTAALSSPYWDSRILLCSVAHIPVTGNLWTGRVDSLISARNWSVSAVCSDLRWRDAPVTTNIHIYCTHQTKTAQTEA